jgi:hypothetical protein
MVKKTRIYVCNENNTVRKNSDKDNENNRRTKEGRSENNTEKNQPCDQEQRCKRNISVWTIEQ